ncbi:MAG: glycosyltransferase family 9 protein, partial [Campylobacterota bacterium]|nr:glycosyltransferase family 9 protein [Campylobacterota bacterium]
YQFNKSYESNVIERNIFLTCSALEFQLSHNDVLNKKPIFKTKNSFTCKALSNKKRNIALVIGASWESKKYPLDKFIELINSNLNYNFLVLSGNTDEFNDAQYIASKSQSTAIEPSSIKNLISLISKVDLVIGNDTGPTHIAWAQNISSITLFGPTNERMICQTQKNLFIKSPSIVNINKIDKNDFSIKDIDVKEINKLMEQLL